MATTVLPTIPEQNALLRSSNDLSSPSLSPTQLAILQMAVKMPSSSPTIAAMAVPIGKKRLSTKSNVTTRAVDTPWANAVLAATGLPSLRNLKNIISATTTMTATTITAMMMPVLEAWLAYCKAWLNPFMTVPEKACTFCTILVISWATWSPANTAPTAALTPSKATTAPSLKPS